MQYSISRSPTPLEEGLGEVRRCYNNYMKTFVTKFTLFCVLCVFLSVLSDSNTPTAQATGLPVITSFSTDFISVTSEAPYTTTIAVYGTGLDYLLFNPVTIQLGPLTASSVSGNDTGVNLTFPVDAAAITNERELYNIVVTENASVILTTTNVIELYNPYQLDYITTQPRQYLNQTNRPHKRTKETIGINVQWALGGDDSNDTQYEQRVLGSNTVWAREHFSYKLLMEEDQAGWLKRYDQIMLQYQASGTKVVGMLAYGTTADEFAAPDTQDWKEFVQLVVQRYRNYVDVWEIWNEPDSSTYLQSNNWKTYKPLLKTASQVIRRKDPDAIVLNGAVAEISNLAYIKQLYKYGRRYFDDLNVHLYYCDEYQVSNDLVQLENDWQRLRDTVATYRSEERIWITELGCSTGLSGVTDKFVKHYNKSAAKWLLSTEASDTTAIETGPILLYTFRDRTYLTAYEAYFGMLQDDFTTKPIWQWYRQLARY